MNTGSLIKGIIIAILIPIVGYAIVISLIEVLASSQEGFAMDDFSKRTQMLIGIMFNLIAFQFFNYRRETETMRGIMIVTIILSIIWAIYFQFFSQDPFI